MEQEASPTQVVLLIPALNPDRRLLELLERLRKAAWPDPMVLVDDGSDEEHRDVFQQAEALGCQVIRHARNLGKGRALKTGFNHCLTHFPGAVGCVTADADGQHTPGDIAACAVALRSRPEALVLGCRDFATAGVPWRSQMGNVITRNVMGLFCGVRTTDTQTGLRGISSSFMAQLLDVPGERFEFETNMLLETARQQVPIQEVPISTVYLENNRSSHFDPLVDSVKIYRLILARLFKFCATSLLCFLVDYLLFRLFTRLFGPERFGLWTVTVCTVLARVISATLNYLLNRVAVFQSKRSAARSGPRYALLCLIQMGLSAGLVTLCHQFLPGTSLVWKPIVDVLLFLVSFQIQRRWVF